MNGNTEAAQDIQQAEKLLADFEAEQRRNPTGLGAIIVRAARQNLEELRKEYDET